MASTTNDVVPSFDFDGALRLSVDERFDVSLERARRLAEATGLRTTWPAVAKRGATEEELANIELVEGVNLPAEYRRFLARCRYIRIDDGREIGGLDHDGVWVTESPWFSDQHREGVPYLVFANYWRYADGDQLMFDLTEPVHPVVAYLHEEGPLYESYAPSFSLALWRLVHESFDE